MSAGGRATARGRPPAPGVSGERGGAALLAVLGGCLVLAAGLVTVAAAVDVGVAAARARTAADAAALAAAAALPLGGGDGGSHAAAHRLAAANGARVVACCAPADAGVTTGAASGAHAVVEVAVPARLPLLRAAAVTVRARAAAALRPGPVPATLPAPGDGLSGHPDQPAGRLQRPAFGHVTSGYGMRVHPVTGRRRMHTGIDIAAPVGTPVVAADDGIVTSAGSRGGYGLTVVIRHGGSLSTLAAHQSRVRVAPGQRVRRGQVVGAVGCTGTCTGPHLHFEVRVGGRAHDPLPYLR